MIVSSSACFLCLFITYEIVLDTLAYKHITLHAETYPQRALYHRFYFCRLLLVEDLIIYLCIQYLHIVCLYVIEASRALAWNYFQLQVDMTAARQ